MNLPQVNVCTSPRLRRLLIICLQCLLVGVCVSPYVGWMRNPSLFDDDFTRVGSLRRSTVAASLLRPFNEHLAPLFELVSWSAWWGAGERITAVATTFLLASYLATLVSAILLGLVVRLDAGSTLGAWVAIILFSLESVAAETVLWYSASSFQWSAATSLAAWLAAVGSIRARSRRARWCWLGGAGLMAGISPLFSAIGVLAGPLATLRLLAAKVDDRRVSLKQAAVPLAGCVAYGLLIFLTPRHGSAVSASLRQHLDLIAASWAVVRAPGLILLPALVGIAPQNDRMPDVLACLTTASLVCGGISWARFDSKRRGLVVAGLGWILGGYFLSYLARAQEGDRWIFAIGRYHLFPLIGLIACSAAGVGNMLDRLEARKPLTGWVGSVALAGLVLIAQGPAMGRLARQSFQFSDQDRSLQAAEQLEAACSREQVPLDQAIRIIDPIRPPWFPRPLPFHPLLYLFGPGPTTARWTDHEARRRVVASLTPATLGLIFGGLDDRPYRGSGEASAGATVPASSWGEQITPAGERLYFAEFIVPAEIDELSDVAVQGVASGSKLEIWWDGPQPRWGRGRSVRHEAPPPPTWLHLNQLPHYQGRYTRRLRILRKFRSYTPSNSPTLLVGGTEKERQPFKPPVRRRGDSETRPTR